MCLAVSDSLPFALSVGCLLFSIIPVTACRSRQIYGTSKFAFVTCYPGNNPKRWFSSILFSAVTSELSSKLHWVCVI